MDWGGSVGKYNHITTTLPLHTSVPPDVITPAPSSGFALNKFKVILTTSDSILRIPGLCGVGKARLKDLLIPTINQDWGGIC